MVEFLRLLSFQSIETGVSTRLVFAAIDLWPILILALDVRFMVSYQVTQGDYQSTFKSKAPWTRNHSPKR
jgi:hypothetical protein